jgi:hypothetical protein
MCASKIPTHTFDVLAAFSLRGETPASPPPDELTPARSFQDLVIALVAVLVALVLNRPGFPGGSIA